jgi:hypothetical protein
MPAARKLASDGCPSDPTPPLSLSWDLVFLAYLARGNGDQRYEGRPLDEIELEWVRGRQVEVLRLLRKTFPTSKVQSVTLERRRALVD